MSKKQMRSRIKLGIDDTDLTFIGRVLLFAKVTHEELMTDPDVCEANRDRHREHAKMAQKAYDLMRAAVVK